MSDVTWIILVNLSGVIEIGTWLMVGIQFYQIGEYHPVRRSLYTWYVAVSLAVVFMVNLGSKYFGSQIIMEGLTIAAIYLSVLLAGRILYNKNFFQTFKVLVMMLCLFGMLGLIQIISNIGMEYVTNNLYFLVFLHQMTTSFYLLLSGGLLRKLFSAIEWGGERIPWRIIPQCFCLLVFSYLLIVTQSYLIFFIRGGMVLMMAGWAAILLTGIFAIDLYGIRERHVMVSEELEVYKKQEELRYAYYKELEEKYNDSRNLIHDIRNHLNAIEGLYANAESASASEYTTEIHGMLNNLSKKYYCDNRMLNIILSDKIENARRKGIKVTVRIGEVHLDWMNDVDITTVFANLLDNAVTAAALVPDEPWLYISVRELRDFIVVEIKNSAVPKNSYELKERKRSGIGLKNVRFTVEKYNGTLETEQDDVSFRIGMVIPLEVV